MKTFDKLKTDIESIKGLVDKYKPIIKKDAMKMKNQFEKDVLPSMKNFGNSFKDSFKDKGVNSKSFEK